MTNASPGFLMIYAMYNAVLCLINRLSSTDVSNNKVLDPTAVWIVKVP